MEKNMWGKVLAKLERRINRPSFNTWIKPTEFVAITQQNVRIGVPNEVFVYWLGEHYVHVIVDALTEILGFQPDISFVVMNADGDSAREVENAQNSTNPILSLQVDDHDPVNLLSEKTSENPSQSLVTSDAHQTLLTPSAKSAQKESPDSTRFMHTSPSMRTTVPMISRSLNSAYTFESYVVGSNNRFAHAAALAVADQMAVNYNPLFIYGGVGLGKTHLLHAIGNTLVHLRPNIGILYLSSEQFINELVGSIRADRMAGFREKYRNIDLLLVDDIQFIARKERTQEEFFHTFNTLYQARKQIVLTSDCPPKKIPTIAEQLRSRFEWGLIADIQPPDLETRLAILRKKADLHQIDLPHEVAIYIASKVKSNIRELEGCLSKIKAYSTFNHQTITLSLAQKVLRDLFDTSHKRVTVELVQQVVANHYQIELASMRSSARTRKITLPRQIAMYLARELTNLSLPDIGRNFGGRDHTTVIHACKKVEHRQAQDLKLKENIMQIRELIQA